MLWVHAGLGQRTPDHFVRGQHVVLRIEEDHDEHFMLVAVELTSEHAELRLKTDQSSFAACGEVVVPRRWSKSHWHRWPVFNRRQTPVAVSTTGRIYVVSVQSGAEL